MMRLFTFQANITSVDITRFLRQLATLIDAGIPLLPSCALLEKSQKKLTLRLLIYSIKKDITTGKTFSHALQQHPHHFDRFTCQLIHLGEKTGQLDSMLTNIAHHQERRLAFQQRIKQALFYPCLMMFIAFLITMGLLCFVIPRFAELFQQNQQSLPALTAGIVYCANQLQQHVIWLIVIVLLLFIAHYYKWPIDYMLHLRQRLKTLPLIKPWMQKIMLARFTRQLAVAVGAGMLIVDALTFTAPADDDTSFTNIIMQLRVKICTGLQLHRAMETFPAFPSLMVQMIKIGEESGKLEHMLNKTADFFEAELEQGMQYGNQLLEPLIMLVLGVLIGGIVIGMYLPLFKLGSTL